MARSMSEVYGGQRKSATNSEVAAALAQGVLARGPVTPANVDSQIHSASNERFQELDSRRGQIFKLEIENEELITVLEKLNIKSFETFLEDWEEMKKKFPDDYYLLVQVIDASCVRTNGKICRSLLKRMMRNNGAEPGKHHD